jgi:plasmid stabilization system protein ParE
MKKRSYVLTKTAESDFRSARNWSLKRWGKSITQQYFKDLHEGAESIVKSHFALAGSSNLTSSEELLVWPVSEHYIIYIPLQNQKIIIVALIRQSRDVPSILGGNRFIIERELKNIKELKLP